MDQPEALSPDGLPAEELSQGLCNEVTSDLVPGMASQESGEGSSRQAKNLMDLPVELRLKVWQYLLHPRVVTINFEEPGRVYASTSLPVALRINQESRVETIAQLTRTESSVLGASPAPKELLFSPQDVVMIHKPSLGKISFQFFVWHLHNRIGDEGFSQIRKLAIEEGVWRSINCEEAKPTEWRFLNLELFIVFRGEPTDEDIRQSERFRRFGATYHPDVVTQESVRKVFQTLLPADRDEYKMPEIHILQHPIGEARRRLPPLPPPTEEEFDTLEDLSLLHI